MDRRPPGTAQQPQLQLEPEDYYFEGPLMVFTSAYHLKRGYCCGSGCRHCPFVDRSAVEEKASKFE